MNPSGVDQRRGSGPAVNRSGHGRAPRRAGSQARPGPSRIRGRPAQPSHQSGSGAFSHRDPMGLAQGSEREPGSARRAAATGSGRATGGRRRPVARQRRAGTSSLARPYVAATVGHSCATSGRGGAADPNPAAGSSSATAAGGGFAAATIRRSGQHPPGRRVAGAGQLVAVLPQRATTASRRRRRPGGIPLYAATGRLRVAGAARRGQLRTPGGPRPNCLARPTLAQEHPAARAGSRRRARRSATKAREAVHGATSQRLKLLGEPAGTEAAPPSSRDPTRSNPASRAASSVSNKWLGRRPTSRSDGRSWTPACSTAFGGADRSVHGAEDRAVRPGRSG